MDRIDAVRAFNRLYLRELGLLDRSYLGSGMGVTEVRVLYELSQGGELTARGLAARLAVDEGYLSRILRGFAARGWLAKHTLPQDRRSHLLGLTDAGKAAMAPLEALSRAEVGARMDAMTADAQDRLVASMADIGRCLDAKPGAAALRRLQPGDAGWVIARHAELYALEEGYDASFEVLVAGILAEFLQGHDPEREAGWIAWQDGLRQGSIFCVRQSDEVAKLRLFLLEPRARGRGLGRQMLDHCLDFARARGYRRIVLWTHASHRAACALYQARGFVMQQESPAQAFGQDVIDQTWAMEL